MTDLITTYAIEVHFATSDQLRIVAKYAHGEKELALRRAREYASDAKAVRVVEYAWPREPQVFWVKPYAGMNR